IDGTGKTDGIITDPYYFSNWMILILPYVEQDTLFKQYDNTVYNQHAKNKAVRETFVSVYTCPSDPNTKKVFNPGSNPKGGLVPFMTGTYRGMGGVTCTGFDQWAGYPSEVDTLQKKCPGKRGILHSVDDWSGIAREKLRNVRDGTSNT